MLDRKLLMKRAAASLRMLAMLGLMFMAWPGGYSNAAAQETVLLTIAASSCDGSGVSGSCWNEIGAQFTVTTEAGEFLGSCTLDGPQGVGILLSCGVDVPDGITVVVTEDVSTITPGYAPEVNPIIFNMADKPVPPNVPSFWGPVFKNYPESGSSSSSQSIVGTSDIAIKPTENGVSITDACFVLVDHSNEGCDANQDGLITFADIPYGTYTVRQTADLGPGRAVKDFTIDVTGNMGPDGYEIFAAEVLAATNEAPPQSAGAAPTTGAVDISLITRDPGDGHLLRDACYILVDYSNEGCDENGDGQVTFDAVEYGTYTVRQTRVPAGYPQINEYDIKVMPLGDLPGGQVWDVPLGFVVRQAPEQNAPGSLNFSVILLDFDTGEKIPGGGCVELVGGSNVGCDEDLVDGQIDFLDVPPGGPYELRFSNLAPGRQVWTATGEPHTLTVQPQPDSPSNLFGFVLLTGQQSGTTSNANVTGNVDPTADNGAIAVIGAPATSVSTAGAAPATDPTSPGVAVELILDTSGSMDERDQDGQTRMEVAQDVTTRLVTETLPPGVPMALRTYSGCSSSLAIPMQPLDPDAAAATIARLTTSGKTPIAQSLQDASSDLAGVSGPKIIILVTDGEETCDGDPQSVIEALVAQDITVQVNIIGFAIDDAALSATFQEWAQAGNGTYYQASNELELDQAVTTASRLPFRVLNQQGDVIAGGNVDGAAASVPAGTYTVEIDTVPVTRYEKVVVNAHETTTVDLNAGVTTGNNSASQSSTNAPQRTWGAAVQVDLCDAPPNSGREMNCHAESGITVNISLASGEWLGSCTVGEPQPTPWNTSISLCSVDGLPFNADFVATQDVSTIPPGYEPYNDPSFLHVDDAHPGGGDQATFHFVNVRTDAGASTSGSSVSSNTGYATLLMTFRGCPEGFDPNYGNFYAECTVPLDAPDASIIVWGGDGQGGMGITELDRQYDGAYIYNAGPGTMNLQLSGMAPVVRDAYQVFGADGASGEYYTVTLVDGETREVFVFYYFE